MLLKFEHIEPLGAWFADRLGEVVNGEADLLAADVVVPVPLHCERKRKGGTTRLRFFPSPWLKNRVCRIKRCYWCAPGRGRISKC